MDRNDGSVDFYKTYSEYENGFGSPYTETWIGEREREREISREQFYNYVQWSKLYVMPFNGNWKTIFIHFCFHYYFLLQEISISTCWRRRVTTFWGLNSRITYRTLAMHSTAVLMWTLPQLTTSWRCLATPAPQVGLLHVKNIVMDKMCVCYRLSFSSIIFFTSINTVYRHPCQLFSSI